MKNIHNYFIVKDFSQILAQFSKKILFSLYGKHVFLFSREYHLSIDYGYFFLISSQKLYVRRSRLEFSICLSLAQNFEFLWNHTV